MVYVLLALALAVSWERQDKLPPQAVAFGWTTQAGDFAGWNVNSAGVQWKMIRQPRNPEGVCLFLEIVPAGGGLVAWERRRDGRWRYRRY